MEHENDNEKNETRIRPRFTFRLYGTSLDAVRIVAPIATAIARHDADLGRQARRALSSMHLNISESMGVEGGNRRMRFRTALGSTNEVIACVDIGVALGYCAEDERAYAVLTHVRAVLLKLVMTKR